MRELRWISARRLREGAQRAARRSSAGATARRRPRRSCSTRCARSSNARLPAKLAARGGLRVYSTVDQRLQFAGRRAIKDVLKTPGDPVGGARLDQRAQRQRARARRPRTTARATNQFNLATAGHRSPGSTFKLFALVDALRRGRRPAAGSTTRPATSRSRESDPVCPQAGGWSPSNADGERRRLHEPRARRPCTRSTSSTRSSCAISGRKQVAATAHLLGIRSKLPLHCSMVLGADDVTPLELTSAYATIAAGGVYHRPRTIRRVEDADGKIVASKQFRVQAQARRQRRRRVRGDPDPQGRRDLRHGHPRAPRRRAPAGRQDGHRRELRQRLVLRLHARHRDVRVGRLPLVQQAAPEHRGLRRGLRRHDPGGDLEGLHDDGDQAHRAAGLAGAEASDGLQAVRRRRRRSATTRAPRRPRPRKRRPRRRSRSRSRRSRQRRRRRS